MSPTAKSAIKRQRLFKALGPGVKALRERILASGSLPKSVSLEMAFREWNLNPSDEADWKVLAWILADELFAQGKPPGRPAWSASQLYELLFAVHERKQKSARLSDQRACELIARDKNSPPYFRAGLRYTEGKGQGLIKRLREARHHFRNNPLARAAVPLAFGRN